MIAAPNSPPNRSASEAGLWGGEDVETPSPRAAEICRRKSRRASSGGGLSASERSTRSEEATLDEAPPSRARKLAATRRGSRNAHATFAAAREGARAPPRACDTSAGLYVG